MKEALGLDLAALAAFVAVGDKNGFRAAGEALGMSSAGVSKAVARIETQLGVMLVARTTRSVRLTSAGTVFHARCKAILSDLDTAAVEASEASLEPRGRLVVSAPISYGRLRVLPVVAEYMTRYAGVEVEIRLSDRVVDLVEEGFDLAVRIGHLPDSGLVATRVAQTSFVLCASPGYVARAGSPRHPDDLSDHTFIGYVLPGTAARFTYRFMVDDAVRTMTFEPRLTVDDGEALVELAMRSTGLVMVADYLAERHLQAGALVRILPTFEVPPSPISIVQLPTRTPSPAARAFTTMFRSTEKKRPLGSASLRP